ncbi:MAG: sulfotransferase domain-containing protein [Cyclobacteriaceae bacterium]|nr:sulfotransferase domain-containing protein [Cyclobacteriaceae bacterium]
MKSENIFDKNIEYNGYRKLHAIFFKIHKYINRFSQRAKSQADKFAFEQFKMKFGEREDDIYISTFPKSGTTLTQMILYQLTTDGNMDFDHIYDVSPWIRNSSFLGKEVPDLPSPRIIKTHDYYKYFQKQIKGKFIFVYRNGMDVAVSMFHQNKNYNNQNLKAEKYIDSFIKKNKKDWFNYTKGWLRNKNNFPILYLKYEDLLNNKEQEIRKIIEFCNLKPDEDAIKRALKYSSFESMKKHENKFGEQMQKAPEKVFNQFIRKGISGEGKVEFSEKQQSIFAKRFSETIKKLEGNIFN